MAKVHLLGVVLILIVVAVSKVEPVRTAITYPQLVELGTFTAADSTCFFKKIFKGQPSPVTFDFIGATAINYVKAVTTTRNTYGGVTMTLVGGTIATVTVSVKIAEAANKNYFVNDITVTMRCT